MQFTTATAALYMTLISGIQAAPHKALFHPAMLNAVGVPGALPGASLAALPPHVLAAASAGVPLTPSMMALPPHILAYVAAGGQLPQQVKDLMASGYPVPPHIIDMAMAGVNLNTIPGAVPPVPGTLPVPIPGALPVPAPVPAPVSAPAPAPAPIPDPVTAPASQPATNPPAKRELSSTSTPPVDHDAMNDLKLGGEINALEREDVEFAKRPLAASFRNRVPLSEFYANSFLLPRGASRSTASSAQSAFESWMELMERS